VTAQIVAAQIFDPASYAFNPFAVPTALATIALIVLAAVVLIREKVSASSVLFVVIVGTVMIWLFTFSWMYASVRAPVALWWAKLAYLGLPFIPSAIYHFTVVELRAYERSKVFVALSWSLSLFFSVSVLTTDMLVTGLYRYWWGHYPKYGPLSVPYLVFFFGMMMVVFRQYRAAYLLAPSGAQKIRIRSFIIAFGIGYLASFDYLPKYGIAVYPFGYLPIFGFLLVAARTIWRYRLVDLTPAFAAEKILETMQGAVVVTDLQSHIRLVNHSACTMLGYQETDLVDLPLRAIFRPTDTGHMGRLGGADARHIHAQEATWLCKGGRKLDVSLSAAVVHDERGRPQGIVYVAQDLTERLEAKAKLHEKSEALEALIEAAPIAIISLDIHGQVTRWNRAAERIFGWSEPEVLGQPPPLVPPDKYEEFCNLRDRVLRGEALSGISLSRQRRDGTSLAISLYAAPLRDSLGTIVGIMAAIMDVTQHRQLEAEFRHAQKMEAVGRLAGGIAHDFNNLLFIINGYADMLLRADAWKPHHEAIEAVRQAGSRAAELTRQLLTFSRKQVLQTKVLDLNTILNGLVKMLERVLGEDISLKIVGNPSLRQITADAGQIEQVIMNLCVNARDAMPHGGRLTIQTDNDAVSSGETLMMPRLSPGSYVTLAVSDTGCGITPEVQARMFDPFFTTKEPGKGTGLGLSTVYGIVTQAGGGILVSSGPGQGTTLKVYFPAADSTGREMKTDPVLDASVKGQETVLLVEDEAGVRGLIRSSLERYGYTVLEAPNGVEALAVTGQHPGPVHVLVTDMVMPYMGGRDVAEQLRRQYPRLKVLYMSGYADEAAAETAQDPFLQKPFTPQLLAETIRTLLK
jgi:two-component system, cell cycle sensor histidine kinase and response regulator CckA